jgi:hypothetical protein
MSLRCVAVLGARVAEVGQRLGISDKVVPRLFVVIPSSCRVRPGFEEYDKEHITRVAGGDMKLDIDRAGQMHREYQLHLYDVKHPHDPHKVRSLPHHTPNQATHVNSISAVLFPAKFIGNTPHIHSDIPSKKLNRSQENLICIIVAIFPLHWCVHFQQYYIPMIANSSVDHLLKMHENKQEPYCLTVEQMMHQRQVMEKRIESLVQNCQDMKNVEIILFDGM